MSEDYKPVDPQLIIGHGINVIRNTTVLENVLESVADAVARGISDAEIRSAFENVLERHRRR